jgi:hypothetical protein
MAGSSGKKGGGPDKAAGRPVPTIEGTATEVTVEPDTDETAPAPSEVEATSSASPPPSDGDTSDTTEAIETPEPAMTPEAAPRRRGGGARGILSHLTAGLLGGLAGAGALALALGYLPGNEPAQAPDLAPLEDRVAKLEAAPESKTGDAELAKLGQRLDDLEGREPETPQEMAALANRVSQLETSLKSMAEAAKDGGSVGDAAAISQQVGEAERRLDAKFDTALAEVKSEVESANAASLEALRKEIAAIEAKLRALAEAELSSGEAARLVPEIAVLDERLGKLEAAIPHLVSAVDKDADDTKAATLAIAFANLRAAVGEGRPYAPELATLAALSPGAGELGALLDYEDTGIPTVPELTRAFKKARDAALAVPAPAAGGSVLDRLVASAESLIKIRRVDAEAEGDAPDAVLARAEAQLEQGKLAGTVKEIETLQGAQRAAFATWLDQARARLGAEETLQRLQNILLVSLSKSAAPNQTDEQD